MFYLFKGLKPSPVSISQICDKSYGVHFMKDMCEIKDKDSDEFLVNGLRISNKCFVIEPNKHELDAFSMSQNDETNLWHQRLSHIKFRDLSRLSKKKKSLSLRLA